MHGTIFVELKKYVETKLGNEAWPKLLSAAGFAGRSYEAFEEYPDADAVKLVTTASGITGLDAAAILEDFGVFIAPDLLEMYWGLIQPSWKTLDVIQHTESAVHEVVRLKNPGARPPRLQVSRPSPNEVVIDYRSQRKLCPVAVGISKGLGKHFRERVEVEQKVCMLRGDDHCEIRVRRVGDA